MKFTWDQAFTKVKEFNLMNEGADDAPVQVSTLSGLKRYLDWVQIKECLLRPYFENEDYPLVESRELLPSFESDAFEYADLPGFSMVALGRSLNYFSEIFQFDILHDLLGDSGIGLENACPLERTVQTQNRQAFLNRLPKYLQEDFKKDYLRKDLTAPENYPGILQYLLKMDRAHVLAKDKSGNFNLAGIYASLPSDLDTEIKRFGLKTGKFSVGDNVRYELNRLFVYQFMMELYGFPIVSERRTSSALFARRLQRMGEDFMVRVLGQSDRTITTLYSHPLSKRYPRVEKIALVQVDPDMKEARRMLGQGRYFVDKKKRVVILRVIYRQHKYNADNVRQDRALSVLRQEVIHPLSGRINDRVNIIKDASNMFLRLNDIVRGEFTGRIVYKRNEVIENTDTYEKRLKFLFAWLSKHQRRIIGYTDEFYSNVVKVLDNYLLNPDHYEVFNTLNDLYQEVWSKYSYIQQARKTQLLDNLSQRMHRGQRIGYLEMLNTVNETLHQLKFEIVNYFEELVDRVIGIVENILHDAYLVRKYINTKEDELSGYGQDIRRNYGRLVAQLDEFNSIRKSRTEQGDKLRAHAV
ncbi:hypothetical protein [Desulfovibrio ferrophilus]|nr:hypothetical protein [Desulfovibrio ferrophilus]